MEIYWGHVTEGKTRERTWLSHIHTENCLKVSPRGRRLSPSRHLVSGPATELVGDRTLGARKQEIRSLSDSSLPNLAPRKRN